MNAKEAPVETEGSAPILLRTIHVNAQENIWEETASTVSSCSCFYGCFHPCPISSPSVHPVGFVLSEFCDSSKHLFHWVHGEAYKSSWEQTVMPTHTRHIVAGWTETGTVGVVPCLGEGFIEIKRTWTIKKRLLEILLHNEKWRDVLAPFSGPDMAQTPKS